MTARVIHGDCLDAMREMPDACVDAIVTDPPYGLSFMGRDWDRGVPGVPFWTEALRVAKPGAHLVAFGGTRMFHRLACAIEDAGWEVRDCLSWLYGSGFPKSLDVSKAFDKAAGALSHEGKSFRVDAGVGTASYRPTIDSRVYVRPEPATDAARAWQGWGTALKPAWEPIVLARKPLIGTVAANVLAHGTGAINVDACRVGVTGATAKGTLPKQPSKSVYGNGLNGACEIVNIDKGRWPANVALDEEAAAMLDEQTGVRISGGKVRMLGNDAGFYAPGQTAARAPLPVGPAYDDNGGASRFFYTAKASRKERGEGNVHPTVKPVALMRWLVRMTTPPGGVVLDPFCGSGSTLVAAIEEGFDCIGIEREAEYVAIIEARVAAAQQAPQRVAKPKPKRQPVKVQPAAKASPMPSVEAPLPGQLALAWDAR